MNLNLTKQVSQILRRVDGSKIFGQGGSYIKAVSTETGEVAGRVEFGFLRVPSFCVRGSKAGIGYWRRGGWDFCGPEVCYFAEFPDRLRLDLVERLRCAGPNPAGSRTPKQKDRCFVSQGGAQDMIQKYSWMVGTQLFGLLPER